MRTLRRQEYIALTIALAVIGFFFVFGGSVLQAVGSASRKSSPDSLINSQQIMNISDTVVGSGPEAMPGKQVTVHYIGKFTDGRVFDSSISRGQPFTFILGAGQVITGWDKGLAGMKVGGKRILVIPPEFGYGSRDVGPIPANSTLVFEVELLDVSDPLFK